MYEEIVGYVLTGGFVDVRLMDAYRDGGPHGLFDL